MRTQTVGWRKGAAAIAGALCVAALVAVVLLATSAGGSSGSYTVRAIFDDAGNIISGENVKIDGVKVGTVGTVVPTPQAQAAVVLNIEHPWFSGLSRRRQLHDRTGGADRREVRQLPADPAPRGGHPAAAAA